MEPRLAPLKGQRLKHLRQTDLPSLALVIVGHARQLVVAKWGLHGTVPVMCLQGRGLSVQVRYDDWAKIVPYLKDGTFNPLLTAFERVPYLQPEFVFTLATLDLVDRDFYTRVLGVLRVLFPEAYPTSEL